MSTNPQVHNASFQVAFLNFEEEDEEGDGTGGGDNMGSIEDDDAVEGSVATRVLSAYYLTVGVGKSFVR